VLETCVKGGAEVHAIYNDRHSSQAVIRTRTCGYSVGTAVEKWRYGGIGHREYQVKQNATLVVTSLLSIFFLTLHITDDIVRGISKAESSNTALLVLVVLLYGTLMLAERRSGHVIMLIVGLLAAAMPVLHMRGAHYPEIARSPGGFFFVWTLWALGGLGGLTFILSARGLWRLGRPSTRRGA